ncbi:MAG: HlyD family type I secretion periplasmic adaptor subunit [Pseudomonadota bacterium]
MRRPSTPKDQISLEDGRLLYAKGDATDVAYLVVDGEIEIYLTEEGESGEVLLSQLGPGEIAGQLGMLEGTPQNASARARGATVVKPLDRAFFLNQLGGGALAATSESAIPQTALAAPQPTSIRADDASLDRMLPWNDRASEVIAAFQPDALEIEHRPFPAIARVAAYSIILFFAAIVTWASVSVIDTSVSTRGVTAPSSSNILVQATEPGIIETLHVSEGDIVQVGDPLVSFDDTAIQADILAAVARRDNMMGRLNRLELEFDNEMRPVAILPVFSEDEFDDQRQRDLYASRLSEFSSRVSSYQRQLDKLDVQATSVDEDLALAREQLGMLRQLEGSYNDLVQKELMSRVQLMSVTFDRLGTEREINQLENQVEQVAADMAVTRADRDVYVSNWFSTLTDDLLNTREQLIQVEEELVTLRQRAQNLDIHATADAIVLETHGFGDGSVIRAAETVVDLVPDHTEILVRLDINPTDISNVTVGARVSVKLDALPFQKHGDLVGRIDFISEDTFDETLLGQPIPVYRARVHIETNQLTDLPPDFRMIPGMTATGDIRTGERRIITYFIYPVLRWVQTSLRET